MNSLFDHTVALFWPPCELLQREDRLLPTTSGSGCLSSVSSWQAKSWWFGRRNEYFVGVFCTAATTLGATAAKDKDGVFQIGKNGPVLSLVVSGCVYDVVL